jgi:hypothetical protein
VITEVPRVTFRPASWWHRLRQANGARFALKTYGGFYVKVAGDLRVGETLFVNVPARTFLPLRTT